MNRISILFTVAVFSCIANAQPRASDKPFHLPDDFFPIMTWDLAKFSDEAFNDPHQGLQSLSECGFTTAGFIRPRHLAICEKLGLKAIGCNAEGMIDWKKLSDAEIDQKVKSLIAEFHDSPALLGYFLKDEPGIRDFPYLAKAVAAVRKYAPGKLAYINLYPGYATLGAPNLSQLGTDSYTEYLEQFVKIVKPDIISYDNYRVEFSMDLKDPKLAASYYNDLLAVRAVALKHDLPFWNIVCCNQIRPFTTPPSPANLAMQAYTTLAAGGSGVTWFKYYQGNYHYAPIDTAGHRTATWSYLKLVNDQVKTLGPIMRTLKSTGVYFSAPPPNPATAPAIPNELQHLPGQLIQSIKCPEPLMIGEFSGGGSYAMIVNLSLERSAKFTLNGASNIQQISPADGTLAPFPKDNSFWLPAGQGVLLKMD